MSFLPTHIAVKPPSAQSVPINPHVSPTKNAADMVTGNHVLEDEDSDQAYSKKKTLTGKRKVSALRSFGPRT